MERCHTAGQRWHHPGGIIGLAQFAEEHSEALNYDLLTRTHYTLDDAGGALSWSALRAFIKNIGGDSALARDLGKATGWETPLQTNILLADIYDLLQIINANLCQMASGGKHKKKIKPYPRPGRDHDTKRKFGKGAVPIDELREFLRRRHRG